MKVGNGTRPWASMLAQALDFPSLPQELLGTTGPTISSIATVTADFRDQYYWIASLVQEHDLSLAESFAPVLTTGHIGSALHRWGRRPSQIAGKRYSAPVIDTARVPSKDQIRYRTWLATRLVPKLIIATQGKTLEAVCDPSGSFIPLVPTISAMPNTGTDIFLLQALIVSPVATAIALHRHLGSALSLTALKLSAHEVGALPLPHLEGLWRQAGTLHRRLHEQRDSISLSDATALLVEAGALMCAAYDFESSQLLSWWSERLDLKGLPDPT